MIVTVAGCGALGSLLAARMIEKGMQVQAFQRKGAQLDFIRRNGITIKKEASGISNNFQLLAASNNPDQLKPSRLVIVLVKAYQTEDIYPVSQILVKNGIVLTLQNGLGNPEKLASMFGETKIAAGIDTHGAYRISPGIVGWGGDGYIILGPWQKGLDLSWVRDFLQKAGLKVTYVEDPRTAIWKKLAINSMVNTTAALTRMKNGELLKNPKALGIMKKLGQETVVAADRAGVPLNFDDIWHMHLENLNRTATNKASMLQDIEGAKQTEIDAISGEILRYARNDEEFPYTYSMYSLLKAIDLHRNIES